MITSQSGQASAYGQNRLSSRRERIDVSAVAKLGETTAAAPKLTWVRPVVLIFAPVLLSAVVWAVRWPSGVRLGYTVREDVTWFTVSLLAMWYVILAVMATVGWKMGRATQPVASLDAADDNRAYGALSLVSLIGVAGTYMLISAHNPGLIVTAFESQQFNLVKEQIPNSPGLGTLRYASIVAGAIALHRVIVIRSFRWRHFGNIALLIMNVLLASRLALLMSILVFIGLSIVRPQQRTNGYSRGKLRWVALGVLLFGLLTLANYSRNANYYRTNFGITNPFTMLLGESVAYIGSPFQVSLATSQATQHSIDPSVDQSLALNATRLATPTFLAPQESQGYDAHVRWYENSVSIDPSLTTNSSVAALFGLLGLACVPFMACVSFIAGFLMAHFSKYRSYMVLASFVLGYCFAELWRTYLFNEGIVWFLLLALPAACWVARRRPGRTRS